MDEISWMGKFDPSFPGELKYAWDNRFAKKPKLIVVLCGSVSSWIDTHILKNRGRSSLVESDRPGIDLECLTLVDFLQDSNGAI